MPPKVILAKVILAFDTSAAHCAAALLLHDGRVLDRFEAMEKGQAERLMPLLENLLAEGGIAWRDLTHIAVGTGPGNFTGVRISVAAARGLALGLGIPALGIPRLQALAQALPRPVTVFEDARRGEVYTQTFTDLGHGPAQIGQPADTAPATPVTGNAAGPNALPPAMPLTHAMLQIAASLPLPQPRPAPFYLRGADAAPPSDPPPVILP